MTQTPSPVLFIQHNSKQGGAPRSLFQIVQAYEAEFGPQEVLFLRSGPVLSTYAGLQSRVRTGGILLPFHGSEVSGMTLGIALRNLLGLLMVPLAWVLFLRGREVVYLNSSALCFYGLIIKILSPHTRVICHIREPLSDTVWGKIIRATLRHGADQFIAISRNELDNLNLPGKTSDVVYNYVHSSDYGPPRGQSLHRRDPAVGPNRMVVGYFARIDMKNGIGEFLDIAERFRSASDIAFCIYGYTGSESLDIAERLKAAGDNVHVYPMVSHVPVNLCDIDVLLVPFMKPHFSRSVVEAAMLGVPSVIYDIVSVNETVEDGVTGYVVPMGDSQAMGDRVAMMRDATLRARLGAAAYAGALDRFSEANYARIRAAILATRPTMETSATKQADP